MKMKPQMHTDKLGFILFLTLSLTPMPLTNHTFLITRPSNQAKQLCTQIENLGGRCVLLPTIAIQPLPPEKIIRAISHLSPQIDKIIFTSANAVHPIMPHWSQIDVNTSIFAIGPGTARTLADFQIAAQIAAKFNSEGLLALPELQKVRNQQIVIFSGIGGHTLLTDELTKRGAKVTKIAVYQRACPSPTDPFPPLKDIWVVISTSMESLKNLWEMVGTKNQTALKEKQLLVINHDMAAYASQLGFKHPPWVADNASDEAILAAIVSECHKYPAT